MPNANGRVPWASCTNWCLANRQTAMDRRCAFMMMNPFHGRFLGMDTTQSGRFSHARVGGAMFMQGAPLVPERPDCRSNQVNYSMEALVSIIKEDSKTWYSNLQRMCSQDWKQ